MCDYSLHSIRNRLATEGEQLVVHRFPTGSLGLAAEAEIRTSFEPVGSKPLWTKIWKWLNSPTAPPCAVCIPPGARLLLRDIPQSLRRLVETGPEEEVTFTQLSAEANTYRDAVRFKNGSQLLLQRLEPGQRVEVLSLVPAGEPVSRSEPVPVSSD
jgi:hypothetical protein